MHPIARLALGLAAGAAVVFLIDRLVWPGTLMPGLIGVVCAVIVLGFAQPRPPSQD